MAATAGQSRWQTTKRESSSARITKSARMMVAGADPGRVNEDIKNALLTASPHWKRISASTTGVNSKIAAIGFNDVKVQRRALLVSDFRFVSRSLAERSRQLEGEFERFQNTFGEGSRGGFAGFADFVEESGKSRRKRRKGVRFEEEEQQQQLENVAPQSQRWDIGFRQEMQNDFKSVTADGWEADLPMYGQGSYQQSVLMTTPSNLSGTYQVSPALSYDNIPITGNWSEGDNNLLYTKAAAEESTQDETPTDDLSEQDAASQEIPASSRAFINDLAIPDHETKAKAIDRLKTVERHLQPDIISTDSISLQDGSLLPGQAPQPHLLSASLDTALCDKTSNISFFYCPHLACHQRLVYQNARVSSTQVERSCVHTECSFVSHDVEGWVKHCNSSHHGGCGFGCLGDEDTH